MEISTLSSDNFNSGELKFNSNDSRNIIIRRGRFIIDKTSHPLYEEDNKYFKRIYCLEYKNKIIYYFKLFGNKDSKSGYYVGFSYWEHQKFLWLQNQHWIQKEENIRYCINIFFLIMGLLVSLKIIRN